VEQIKRGQTQFAKSCGFCHGPTATNGEIGPNLIRSSVVRHDANGELISKVVINGRPDRGMPPIPLTPPEIEDVVVYLHSRVAEADRTSAGRPRNFDLTLLLTGNAEAGKAYFNGAGGCSSCHSPEHDLAGIAGKYAPVDLQARVLYPPGQRLTATITPPSGKAIEGTVEYLSNYDIGIIDHDGWYRSWRLDAVKAAIHNPLAAHLELLHKYTQADVHNLFAYLETLH
jgi:cytochrome c oxidase cbb3-type subunit 3